MRISRGLLAAFLVGTPVFSSQGALETPVFRVTSARVVAEFIAIDKQGRIVPDLTLDEIELLVDGKKQKVDLLVPPSPESRTAFVTPGQVAPGSPGSVAAGDAISTRRTPLHTAILLDTRALDANNFARSIAAIRLFISQSLRADSPVMLAEIDRGLKVITPFTQDSGELLEALQTLRPTAVYNPLAPERLKAFSKEYFDELQKQVIDMRQGLSQLCQALSGTPGRKHIVFFSEGYPMNPLKEVDRGTRRIGLSGAELAANPSLRDPGVVSMVQDVTSLANTFGISFYPVDARGLVAVAGIGSADQAVDFAAGPGEPMDQRLANYENSSETGATEVQVATFELSRLDSLNDAQNTLVALAAGTNGSAFFNSNDLGAVLRASTSEPDLNYLASFAPKLKGKPQFRRLQIKSRRKDVVIRHQVGFTDYSDDQLLNSQLAIAFNRPDLFNHLQPILESQAGSPEVVFGVRGDRVSARPRGDLYHIELLFAGQIRDPKGKPVSEKLAIQRGFAMDLNRDQFQSLQSQPLLAREELKLKSGKYTLVLAVFDKVAGSMGAVTRKISVP